MERTLVKPQRLFPIAAVAAMSLCAGAALPRAPLASSANSPAFSGHRFASQAKVTLEQARAIAQKARPGTFTDEELEREHGGSGLRYSFDIKSASVTWEVGVDAKTGQVLENDREGPNAD
jgi:uncharacterized membrane protein YkoI